MDIGTRLAGRGDRCVGSRSRRLGLLVASTAGLLGLAAGSGCGDGDHAGSGALLFDGPAAALAPHEPGSETRFAVTVSQGNEHRETVVRRRVVASNADGTFAIDTVAAGAVQLRETFQDTGDEILLRELTLEPDAAGARPVAVIPPATRVRTPVVAGELIESSFVRALDLDVTVDGQASSRTVVVRGIAGRTARAVTRDPRGGSEAVLRYETTASGRATIQVAGLALQVELESAGEEWLAPGRGLVAASERLRVRVSGRTEEVRVETRAEP